jgi:hypothetical protein
MKYDFTSNHTQGKNRFLLQSACKLYMTDYTKTNYKAMRYELDSSSLG